MQHPNNTSAPTLGTGGRRPCESWGDTRHILLQIAHLSFTAAFLIPGVRRPILQLVVRALLSLGFFITTIWAILKSCTGPDVIAWNATLFLANCAQATYAAYRILPPRISPDLQEFYLKVFAPLKVDKGSFQQLVRYAHREPLDPGEHYAMEGVTEADQRLAVLLTGKMKVTCEDILLHYLLPTEFVDSPEWESCANNTDKRFQVTLTATEPCQLLCWGRRELLTILDNNPYLNTLIYNLIGKDITHKLYSLNEQHRRSPHKSSIADSLEFWRNLQHVPRSHSLDMLHTGHEGHVRSLVWKKPEKDKRRTCSIVAEHGEGSRTSNYSDPGPTRTKRKVQIEHKTRVSNATPV